MKASCFGGDVDANHAGFGGICLRDRSGVSVEFFRFGTKSDFLPPFGEGSRVGSLRTNIFSLRSLVF